MVFYYKKFYVRNLLDNVSDGNFIRYGNSTSRTLYDLYLLDEIVQLIKEIKYWESTGFSGIKKVNVLSKILDNFAYRLVGNDSKSDFIDLLHLNFNRIEYCDESELLKFYLDFLNMDFKEYNTRHMFK